MQNYQLPEDFTSKIIKRLEFIYGDVSDEFLERFFKLIKENTSINNYRPQLWSEDDVVLITYGDSVKSKYSNPLQTLHNFVLDYFKEIVSIVHILPFFPYSSDDGFSVIDYYKVNPEIGDWKDVQELAIDFDLMVDLVINHISSKSDWFKNFLMGQGYGKEFFLTIDPKIDVSDVIRPRSSALLSEYETSRGKKHVWTTFSRDQVDLNFSNPEVLLEMIKVLFFYLRQGSRIVRLDAIAFLWKEIGTSCLHLPETHEVVKLMRDITSFINPSIILLTETNVPNKENLSYFGINDEAHMVYQFSLPPLLLHALHTGNSKYLTSWAKTIPDLPEKCTFFNFTASHDGIGVRPLEGLLPEHEKHAMINKMKAFGGLVSTKRNKDGSDSPYELNITYYDALKGTSKGEDNLQAERFICSQTIMAQMKGVPAFYIQSLLAAENDYEGVKKRKMNRAINRKKWDLTELEERLEKNGKAKFILDKIKDIMHVRKQLGVFHPNADQQIIDIGEKFFVMKRISTDTEEKIVCVSNLTDDFQQININSSLLNIKKKHVDILSDMKQEIDMSELNLKLKPYQTCWLIELNT